ncbi:hypothetical protein IPA_01765 [Ignicoccus pacificus DSM 13166]|uniref:VapB-type antitoxin n=1 Tax=Ignicoccus pacificus DSM 13166 TaxID=940294 RepID=A0A977KAU3_9CREN|nr:hypothetical protein IPA_01765 [Ignicoccus pacificus DSM 13166]
MSVVFSVRIPKELKEKMEKMNVNWAEEVRRFLEQRVKEEEEKKVMEELKAFRSSLQGRKIVPSEALIREVRDSR